MKNRYKLLITLFLAFYMQPTIAQNLVQNYIEINCHGDTQFGKSVSNAGDVNGDGFDDLIVSAINYLNDSQKGRVYIYFGGSNTDNLADVILTNELSNCDFGFSVSGAGDINGDSYDDVIVGASGYNSGTGCAFIYYGGDEMDSAADIALTGESESNWFGCSVSEAGDVNNDGFDDLIIGAYGFSSEMGRAYIYFGGESLDTITYITLTGETTFSDFGFSVSCADDVNNDGYGDLIVGAYHYNSFKGRAYIFFGANNIDNLTYKILEGATAGDRFGRSVSSAGDVNNDGYSDVIVGAYGYSSNTGRAYIYCGGYAMDSLADVTMLGEATNNYFGFSVSGAGDVNNDGYSDMIVGAYKYSTSTGRAYIYYGGAAMNSTADKILSGETAESSFGYSVSNAGDVNGDGYDDVIIGAFQYNMNTGSSYLYFGRNSMNTVPDLKMTGDVTDNCFGYSISGAGDVNNDGFDDIIVGAMGYYAYRGRFYIYFGGADLDNKADFIITGSAKNEYMGRCVAGVGDVNGDGYDDVIVSADNLNTATSCTYLFYGGDPMDTIVDQKFTDNVSYSLFGHALSGAGDVNNDGYADILIAAYGYSLLKGRAYIYFGGENIDNAVDVIFTGEASDDYFGWSVSGAGDVNGDSYDDVIVGSIYASSYIGNACIFYGGKNMDNSVDITLTGETANNYFGGSVSDAGDVNQDGYSDIIVGASGYNSSTGRAYIFYGGNPMNDIADVILTGEATSSGFGISVSGAGDANNDGFDDVIVGASNFYSKTGRTYLFYGGNSMNNIVDFTMTGEEPGIHFGRQVADAGDVNGDGRNEIIVGATHYQLNGKVYLYNFKISQAITFNPLANIVYGVIPFKLVASTTSGLPVTFASSNENIATISGDTITIVGAGSPIITASQQGDSFYSKAANIQQPLIVNPASLTISANRIGKEIGTAYAFSGTEFTTKGLLNGDEVTVATISSPGATSNASMGTYPIVISDAVGTGLDNYEITYEDGIMTVLEKIDTVLTVGNNECYNALLSVVVSGVSPVVLESGSSSTYIAGNSIRFLPGFYAQEGSSLSAIITSNATFCDIAYPKSVIEHWVIGDQNGINKEGKSEMQKIKIFPNPNTGTFTLELTNFKSDATIVVYNLLGEKIVQYRCHSDEIYAVDLGEIRKGIYFVSVSDGENWLMKKMIIR